MTVESATVVDVGHGHRALDLLIDGRPARVFEPKRELLALGIVVLLDVADGAPWSERTSVMVPADSGAGRPAAELLRGGTSDPAVVAIAGRFAAALDSVDLPPGPFL